MKKKFKNISLVGASNTQKQGTYQEKLKAFYLQRIGILLTEEIFDSTIGDKSKNKFIKSIELSNKAI